MGSRLLSRVEGFFQRLDFMVNTLFRGHPPSDAFCLVGVAPSHHPLGNGSSSPFSLKDLIGDGFLWAVPRNRRTIERRLKRKYGSPEYKMKTLLPKSNLRVCNQCGKDQEVGLLCPHCYKTVIEETTQMRDKIQKELGLNPVEEEVVVLYDGEKTEQPNEYWKGKRVVEMEKPRPMWFSKNLLQKSTQKQADTKEIKPNDLS